MGVGLTELFKDKKKVLDKIDSFSELEVNWDSYGGAKITALAIQAAKAIVDGFYTWANASLPMVFPTPDGGVSLAWGDEDIYIDVSPEGRARVWTDGVLDE